MSFTMSQGMSCHTIAFWTLVASWHSLESSKKKVDILSFYFFFTAFQSEQVQLLGWEFSHQNRNVLYGLQDLLKPRDTAIPREARKWDNTE